MNTTKELMEALTQLSYTLSSCGLWQDDAPNRQALMSTEPFAIDTLMPEQWLQWIFIPKMQELIKQNMDLPKNVMLAPYFTEVWKHFPEYHAVIAWIERIDEICQSC